MRRRDVGKAPAFWRRATGVLAAAALAVTLAGCGGAPAGGGAAGADGASGSSAESSNGSSGGSGTLVEGFHNDDLGCGWEPTGSLQLDYAQNFTVDYYEGGYKLICTGNGERFLVVPEGMDAPEGLADDIAVIFAPVDDVYLVASNAMCLFDALGIVDDISVSGIKPENLSVDSVKSRMDSGQIAYGGGSSAPDYELITERGCSLAIESTMINHNPDIKQKLKDLGVVVLTEHSSYEPYALGRVEWVKLYGALFDREEEAAAIFDEQRQLVESVSAAEPSGKTVAFFYINSNGSAVVRKSGDYVAQMIELAGGDYIFDDLGGSESATATVTMEMEQFYATAKDADYIIYNATIDGGVGSLSDLVAKNGLLEQFRAVQNGNVWCTDQDMYQQMIHTGEIVSDMHAVLSDPDATGLAYLYRLS